VPRDLAWPAQATRRGRFARLWRLWRQRVRNRRETERFEERDLRDLGVARGDLHREFARRLPPW
jgi:uncharacterized protein YjiS (DUF1127 family)